MYKKWVDEQEGEIEIRKIYFFPSDLLLFIKVYM